MPNFSPHLNQVVKGQSSALSKRALWGSHLLGVGQHDPFFTGWSQGCRSNFITSYHPRSGETGENLAKQVHCNLSYTNTNNECGSLQGNIPSIYLFDFWIHFFSIYDSFLSSHHNPRKWCKVITNLVIFPWKLDKDYLTTLNHINIVPWSLG